MPKKIKKINFKEFEEFTRSVVIIELWGRGGGRWEEGTQDSSIAGYMGPSMQESVPRS